MTPEDPIEQILQNAVQSAEAETAWEKLSHTELGELVDKNEERLSTLETLVKQLEGKLTNFRGDTNSDEYKDLVSQKKEYLEEHKELVLLHSAQSIKWFTDEDKEGK